MLNLPFANLENVIFPGELWLGLDTIHQLTSKGSYSLQITMKDYDGQTYVAIFDQFQVLISCSLISNVLFITVR